jgi:hypothetical protein
MTIHPELIALLKRAAVAAAAAEEAAIRPAHSPKDMCKLDAPLL